MIKPSLNLPSRGVEVGIRLGYLWAPVAERPAEPGEDDVMHYHLPK